MKAISSLLLALAGFFSLPASAQYTVYPKWYESIPGRPGAPGDLSTAFDEPIPVKTISLSTGIKLEYIEQGDQHGIPVIFLHGFPDSWRSYEQVLRYLPASLHVFVISQRGHGNSDKPAAGYFPPDFAADLAAFMQAQKISSAVIVGHSLGASITQQFVIKYPGLVRGFVLEGAIASFDDKKDMTDFKQVVDQLKDPLDTALSRQLQQSTLANAIDKEYFNTLVNESLKVKAHVWKGVWQGLMTANYRAALHTVKKPALILWGEKDNFSPHADQQFFVTAIEGSVLIEYKGTGHSLHWEQPKRFAEDVTAFIQSIK